MQTTEPTIPHEDVRALFDIATHSLDFGSGFLDKEEIDLLRRTAEALGVDPMEGTPSCAAKNYEHRFKLEPGRHTTCGWDCGRPAADPVHGPDGEAEAARQLAAMPGEQLAAEIAGWERQADTYHRNGRHSFMDHAVVIASCMEMAADLRAEQQRRHASAGRPQDQQGPDHA